MNNTKTKIVLFINRYNKIININMLYNVSQIILADNGNIAFEK